MKWKKSEGSSLARKHVTKRELTSISEYMAFSKKFLANSLFIFSMVPSAPRFDQLAPHLKGLSDMIGLTGIGTLPSEQLFY
jgi:hypothetical protein